MVGGGLQRKWLGLKQRTEWRFRTLKDKNTAIVFSTEEHTEKEIHIKPQNRQSDDPMACHNVLARVSTTSLNNILGATAPNGSSLYCKTMTGFMLHSCAPTMREKILDVITKQRLGEISIANRAVIVRAIQRCLLSPLHTEKAVLRTAAYNVLLGTYGKDLSLLKELINTDDEDDDLAGTNCSTREAQQHRINSNEAVSSEDIASTDRTLEPPHSGDLSHLIYSNKNVTEVVRVMQHIAVEALKVTAEEPKLIKVVSDIDDTLFAGWLDRRYPVHVLYPGVTDLYARISRGLIAAGKGDKMPSITFLTARPRGWLSVGRYLTVQHLNSLGVPKPTVLNGSVRGLISSKRIASLKLDNFTRYVTLFPEFQFVFFGDSGQGDALLASRLVQMFPDQVLGAFIHDVTPGTKQTGDGQLKSFYQAQGIHFFNTYVGAAGAAHAKGLLSSKDVREVIDAAQAELENLSFVGPRAADLKKVRQQELRDDIAAVEQELKSM
ncbi:TPA: hypothetical protein N0F65_012210 [Lagenidium giganteum]|uniref:Phosphatidate phosphatase APP1 catalytic domain-containing protein n=1 Tax=Lagenidium giganteum TaxID=4803 RepID=A0AAV2ZD21_9STRA|nr:TPA: hypothetical protein N0F65_012210 [Lagenidium giganteum]